MTSGIHHVTAITRRVQANVDFYVGFLGLRLVKQTGGFEDAEQLHLIYGDQAGSPGSLVTFLVWENGSPGRVGLAQVSEIALAVPPDSIGEWLGRAMAARIQVDGPAREFGETVLRLRDPDGIIVKLVGHDMPAAAPLPDPIAPTCIRGVTILTNAPDKTAEFAGRFGFRAGPVEGTTRRLMSDSDALDIRDATGFFPGIPGTGMFDHIAFRAADADAVRRMRLDLRDAEGVTNVHDRKYFLSLYVREPGGTLFEYATDGPGMAVDEDPDHLGETLMIPPHDAARAADLRVMLPQFALPGEERMPMRDLPFVHRFHRPENPDGSVIVTLHGTGADENQLMPLAARINPRATILGVRGRATEEGFNRWFRRHTATTFDQDDVRDEAAAFAAFVPETVRSYGLDANRITFLGYSNGANLLWAILMLHPGVLRRAILLRSMAVLDDTPVVDLKGTDVLLLSGDSDPYGAYAPPLEKSLRDSGANLTVRSLPTGHGVGPEDADIAAGWMAELDQPGGTDRQA